MKYIVVGLGNFGASLAEKLTLMGNEVIGIDIKMNRVDELKERITHTICLDASDESTVSGLPLKDTDCVIIAIGEDQGLNIMVTALFKNLKAKKVISRSLNNLHEQVLYAIGVDDIVRPEQETASRWAKKLSTKGILDSFEVNPEFSIIELEIPKEFINKTVGQIQFRKNYNVLLVTTIRLSAVSNTLGNNVQVKKAQGVAHEELKLEAGDILVLYGRNKDLTAMMKKTQEED